MITLLCSAITPSLFTFTSLRGLQSTVNEDSLNLSVSPEDKPLSLTEHELFMMQVPSC